ncbi:elongation factor P 5-aminopentanone reductase [Aquisalibacillus elongatus]|uniref:3-oxoacyl-[acyl-carrier protein] reductase n=1 Tax=Aquisalibacillus elongatus TaxID=485577 RepID=A0A3N5BL78_9BACI|nr:SDR family oxidoreductase [Aquisalibacillus elongatus]RPF55930.1 3-oxoacyl-[acyl-carrier protein] reductase [Aquisalibacillus elongatus]
MKATKNVLIIGSSGEIGQAIVKEISEQDFQFVLHYNQNVKQLNQTLDFLSDEQVLMTIQSDLTKEEDINCLIESIPFHIDIVIFAQGEAHYQLLIDTDPVMMDRLYHIHVKSTMLISKALISSMVRRKFGKIIVISSIWGEVGSANEVVYSTMKGAQISFVKALAKELSASNIHVNAISPGYIDSKMNQHLDDEEEKDFLSMIPLKRAGTSKDVAKGVLFLCSNDSSYVQGQVIRINGGQL